MEIKMKRLPWLIGLLVMMLLSGEVFSAPAGGSPSIFLPVVSRGTASPILSGCAMFPPDNPWNTDISNYPLHPNSANFIADINAEQNNTHKLHADFGENLQYGIPYVIVPGTQPYVPIELGLYGDESDPGPYPIPPDAPEEGDGTGDSHVLVLNSGNCTLYELYHANYLGPENGNAWFADSAAIWPLNTNALRPEGWTSADAAGLPILPGLARYDEVAAGEIKHALRFTVWRTQRGYIHPATHFAGSTPTAPPMGLRLRLKASYNISGFTGQARVILVALKKYGMIVADNGSSWFISGAPYFGPGAGWDDDDLNQLKTVPGAEFEVVNTGPIISPP
jgi:hypothetical protein